MLTLTIIQTLTLTLILTLTLLLTLITLTLNLTLHCSQQRVRVKSGTERNAGMEQTCCVPGTRNGTFCFVFQPFLMKPGMALCIKCNRLVTFCSSIHELLCILRISYSLFWTCSCRVSNYVLGDLRQTLRT